MKTVVARYADHFYAWLCELADNGQPCPSSAAIAARYNFKSVSSAAILVTLLRDDGRIKLHGGSNWRTITIVATGQQITSVRPDTSSHKSRATASTPLPVLVIPQFSEPPSQQSQTLQRIQTRHMSLQSGRPYGIIPGFNSRLSEGCKFIEGEDFIKRMQDGHEIFCGAKRVPGSSWCADHRARCFTPSKKLSEDYYAFDSGAEVYVPRKHRAA